MKWRLSIKSRSFIYCWFQRALNKTEIINKIEISLYKNYPYSELHTRTVWKWLPYWPYAHSSSSKPHWQRTSDDPTSEWTRLDTQPPPTTHLDWRCNRSGWISDPSPICTWCIVLTFGPFGRSARFGGRRRRSPLGILLGSSGANSPRSGRPRDLCCVGCRPRKGRLEQTKY